MVIIPSACMSLFRSKFTIADFYVKFAIEKKLYLKNFFTDLYKYFSIINFEGVGDFFLWILGIIVLISGIGLLFSSVERRMRLGIKGNIRWLSLINDSIILILPYIALLILSLEIIGLITSGLIGILYVIIGGGMSLFIISLLLVISIYITFTIMFVYTCLTIPCLLIDGYNFNFAVSYSISLVQNDFKRMFLEFAVPVGISYLINSGIEILIYLYMPNSSRLNVVEIIIWFIFYVIWMMYLPISSVANYMRLTGVKEIKSYQI